MGARAGDCACGADCQEIERSTQEQSKSDRWFSERICRLTASTFGRVRSRTRNFETLVSELLYRTPSGLPSLVHGRKMEQTAAEQYAVLHPEFDMVSSGLVVHPTLPYLAASPDRVLINRETGERGVLEIKCPSSITSTPTIAPAEATASFCLHLVDGKVTLKKTHHYYAQVLGQMACCGAQWCDFAVLSGGELFVERINFDALAWSLLQQSLTSFFHQFYGPELVYPAYTSI